MNPTQPQTTDVSAVITSVAGVTTVNSISISSNTITSNQLDALLGSIISVVGSVQFSSLTVGSISMAALQSVGGSIAFTNNVQVSMVNFGNLTSVNGSFTMANHPILTAAALSNGFPQLQSVGGMMQLITFSTSGGSIQTSLILPEVVSLGSLDIRNTYAISVSMPALQTIGGAGQQGTTFFQNLAYLRNLDFPALASVSGGMQLLSLNVLANLCQVALPSTGYLTSSNVREPMSLASHMYIHPPPCNLSDSSR